MDWLGSDIADEDGRPYARLDDVFLGRTSGQPEFGFVTLLDQPDQRVAVPLTRARSAGAGRLTLGVARERVMAAPRVQTDVDEIPAATGKLILEHFGIADTGSPSAGDQTAPLATVDERGDHLGGDVGDDAAEVTRSEEQLSVGTRAHAAERVRVRKRVFIEDVTLTVTLRREELVIDREPIAEGAPGLSAPSEFPLAEDGGEVEFVLHAEEPVVTKRIVPVERVRLHRETTTEDRHVTDTVRKERVEVDETPLDREEPQHG